MLSRLSPTDITKVIAAARLMFPDTFIARKVGVEEVLKHGGVRTVEGMDKLHEMDFVLRKESNLLNPGTTADINAAALALGILSGYRPCVRAQSSKTIRTPSLLVAGGAKMAISGAIAVLAFPCSGFRDKLIRLKLLYELPRSSKCKVKNAS